MVDCNVCRLAEPLRFRFACCGEEEVSVGCRTSHPCCRQEPGASPGCLYTFPCCGGGPQVGSHTAALSAPPWQAGGCIRRHLCCNKEEGVAGCRQVCKKCEQPWGSPTQDCFRYKHNIQHNIFDKSTFTGRPTLWSACSCDKSPRSQSQEPRSRITPFRIGALYMHIADEFKENKI